MQPIQFQLKLHNVTKFIDARGCCLAYKRLVINQSFFIYTPFQLYISLNTLAAERRKTMSKYFTYEERLNLQKYLKESCSFKEIGRRLDKNPTTISREVRKHLSEVATGYPGFPAASPVQ